HHFPGPFGTVARSLQVPKIPQALLDCPVASSEFLAECVHRRDLRLAHIFQENVDQMATRSVKLPGQDQWNDVRSRVEQQATQQYNQRQAAKPQGQYRGTPSQDTGKKAYEPGMTVWIRGVPRTVSKVYSDGTFDVQ